MTTSILTTTIASITSISTPTKDPYHLNLNPEMEAYRSAVRASVNSNLTPLNITLLILLLSVIYFRLVRTPPSALASIPASNRAETVVFQTFTPRTLLRFNGHPNPPMNPDGKVYLAVKGKVYDVTSGRQFYGPGGPYENFAGRDATRGLACQSFDEEMLTKDLDGDLDDCKDLGKDELDNLQGWVERFDEKYLVVGNLKAFNLNKIHGTGR